MIDCRFALIAAKLYPHALCSSLPSNYKQTFCTIPDAVLGIDAFIWFRISFDLTNYPRFLFCITLGIEFWKLEDRSGSASQILPVKVAAEPPKQETAAESPEIDNQAAATKTEGEIA